MAVNCQGHKIPSRLDKWGQKGPTLQVFPFPNTHHQPSLSGKALWDPQGLQAGEGLPIQAGQGSGAGLL